MRLHDFAQLADLHRGLWPLLRLEFDDLNEIAKLEGKIRLICSTQRFSDAFWVELGKSSGLVFPPQFFHELALCHQPFAHRANSAAMLT
jgi:hypothetical protein